MGRIITPTYRIEFTGGDLGRMMRWKARQDGRPTPENIEKFVAGYVKSSRTGGTNEHLGRVIGRELTPPSFARIVRQSTGVVVAEWRCPPFWVIT